MWKDVIDTCMILIHALDAIPLQGLWNMSSETTKKWQSRGISLFLGSFGVDFFNIGFDQWLNSNIFSMDYGSGQWN